MTILNSDNKYLSFLINSLIKYVKGVGENNTKQREGKKKENNRNNNNIGYDKWWEYINWFLFAVSPKSSIVGLFQDMVYWWLLKCWMDGYHHHSAI